MTRQNWSRAYALQALSDLRAREALLEADVDRCHRLHFLQMAAEKTCKAHLSDANENDDVKRSHAYIRKVLPVIAREFYPKLGRSEKISGWQLEQLRRLAAEVEVLAPACDAGDARNDNTEYPWLDAQGTVQVPCEYKFLNIDDGGKALALMVKLLRAGASSYAR
jgi:hypothetical protein